MTYPILIKDAVEVERVSRVACESGVDMLVSSGVAMIDPRSILGLFTFVGKNALLVAPDDICPEYFMHLVKKMGVSA